MSYALLVLTAVAIPSHAVPSVLVYLALLLRTSMRSGLTASAALSLELCHAMAGALTLSSYGYNRMRYCPRLQKHSKSVPLSLTRRDGHEKPLLFFVPLT